MSSWVPVMGADGHDIRQREHAEKLCVGHARELVDRITDVFSRLPSPGNLWCLGASCQHQGSGFCS